MLPIIAIINTDSRNQKELFRSGFGKLIAVILFKDGDIVVFLFKRFFNLLLRHAEQWRNLRKEKRHILNFRGRCVNADRANGSRKKRAIRKDLTAFSRKRSHTHCVSPLHFREDQCGRPFDAPLATLARRKQAEAVFHLPCNAGGIYAVKRSFAKDLPACDGEVFVFHCRDFQRIENIDITVHKLLFRYALFLCFLSIVAHRRCKQGICAGIILRGNAV